MTTRCGWTGGEIAAADPMPRDGAEGPSDAFDRLPDISASRLSYDLDALTSPAMMDAYVRGAEALRREQAREDPSAWLSGLFLGVPSGSAWSRRTLDWGSLLGEAAWLANTMNPVSDIHDAVAGSERFSQGVLGGDWEEAVSGFLDVGGGLLGIAVPGHYRQYKDVSEEAVDMTRRVLGDTPMGVRGELPGGADALAREGRGGAAAEEATLSGPAAARASESAPGPTAAYDGGTIGGPAPAPDDWAGAPRGEPPGRPSLSPEGVPLTATHVGGWYGMPRGQIDWLGKQFNDQYGPMARQDLEAAWLQITGEPLPATAAGFAGTSDATGRFAVFDEGLDGFARLFVPAHEGTGHGLEHTIWGPLGLDEAAFAALPPDLRAAFDASLRDHSALVRPGIVGTAEDVPREWWSDALASYVTRGPWFREAFPEGAAAIRRLVNSEPRVSRLLQLYALPGAALLGLDMLGPLADERAPAADGGS